MPSAQFHDSRLFIRYKLRFEVYFCRPLSHKSRVEDMSWIGICVDFNMTKAKWVFEDFRVENKDFHISLIGTGTFLP